jgi:transposase
MEDQPSLPGMESVDLPQLDSAALAPVDITTLRFRRPDRSQGQLVACSLDDLIRPDHPVRTLWAVVETLDLTGFVQDLKVQAGQAGRPATDVRLLVAILLWAATQGVGSCRRMERLCREDNTYRWLCGGLSVNHHSLSDFRGDYEAAVDDLMTNVLAALMHKNLVKVHRISQDGLRVRASAGNNSFRRRCRLEDRLTEARNQVQALKAQREAPDAPQSDARKEAARIRAARQRAERTQKALKALEEVEKIRKQSTGGRNSKHPPRASTTDPDARVMKTPGGGYHPAYNVQLATDTQSRAIVGVDVTNAASDKAQSEPMRQQVEDRTGQKVEEHLMDGGYVNFEQLERAQQAGVKVYAPPQARKDGVDPCEVLKTDSPQVARWRERMAGEEGKTIYKQRAATSETVNADLRTYRGLGPFLVRGLSKVRCVALWSALAYNLLHFGKALLMN